MNSLCCAKPDKAVCSNSLHSRWLSSNRAIRPIACGLTIFFAAAMANSTLAQSSSALTAVYGRGVHAYFAGNSAQAEQHFTEVIQAGSSDPRPYYFRAVLRLQQGRQFEAENDMRIGAAYEARNPGVQHAIGRALQRVQGPARRTLEQFRRQAKLERVQQGRQQNQQRYENLRQRAPNVLRQPAAIPLNQPVGPPQLPSAGSSAKSPAANGSGTMQRMTGSGAKPQPLPAQNLITPQPAAPTPAQPALGSGTKVDDNDPFGAPAPMIPGAEDVLEAGAPTTPTPAPATVAEPDPFGDLPAPAEEADPFGESAAPSADDSDPFGESAAPTEEAMESAPADDDPFGAGEDAAESDDSDPFGEPSDEPMESEEADSGDDPFGESGSDESEDPFGDSSDEPMESEETDSDDDPFGDSSSDTEDEDPFGEDSADSSDETPADDDPFGESMEEDDSSSESDSDSEEAPVDEDDPFGPLGGGPAVGGNAFAAQPTAAPTSNVQAAAPGGQFFYALGQWLGSQGNAIARSPGGDSTVALADFQLGPTQPRRVEPASAEMAADNEDPFGEDPFGDDPFGSE